MITDYELGKIYHGHRELTDGEHQEKVTYWVHGRAEATYITIERDTYQELQEALKGYFGLILADEDRLNWIVFENGLRTAKKVLKSE